MGMGRGYRSLPRQAGSDATMDLDAEVQALKVRLKYLKERLANGESDSP